MIREKCDWAHPAAAAEKSSSSAKLIHCLGHSFSMIYVESNMSRCRPAQSIREASKIREAKWLEFQQEVVAHQVSEVLSYQ